MQAVFVEGLGNITPSQDHTPSLACKIKMNPGVGSAEVPIRRQELPQCGPHGMAQMLLSWKGNLTSEGKAGGRVSGFWQGVDQLLDGDEVLLFAGLQVLQVETRKRVGILLTSKALFVTQR